MALGCLSFGALLILILRIGSLKFFETIEVALVPHAVHDFCDGATGHLLDRLVDVLGEHAANFARAHLLLTLENCFLAALNHGVVEESRLSHRRGLLT